uniref:cysteine dioxygenase n=1 Tax=Anthurium amnicola TaxID=1678845 RepID=A0A1D1XGT4_9ARAE
MRVEGGLAEREGLEPAANKSSSRKGKRRQRKPPAMPTLVQKLYVTCREVFSDGRAGVVPSTADVEHLRSVLDHMNPADVGLDQNMRYFRNFGNTEKPPVTYLHLYECDEFSIGIFCLPPSAVIPLHNHPGMTVFSKLLFGSMHIRSYDWAETPQQAVQPDGMRLARVKTDATFTAPCNTSILYPASGGNMHCFTALTSCAVLDVLGPPYSDDQGRHCTYYSDSPHASFSEGDGEVYAWLEEKEKPEDFHVVGAKYRGPRVVVS